MNKITIDVGSISKVWGRKKLYLCYWKDLITYVYEDNKSTIVSRNLLHLRKCALLYSVFDKTIRKTREKDYTLTG